MRVKIGNEWHEVTLEKPIMLELTAHDRGLVANMHPDCTRLAYFDDRCTDPVHSKRAWMAE